MHKQARKLQASRRTALAVVGRKLKLRPPREGKVEIVSKVFCLLKVKAGALEKINRSGAAILSTRHNHSVVRAGEVVAGTRIIPLLTRESKIDSVVFQK